MKYIISGGFGDAINQIAKAIHHRKHFYGKDDVTHRSIEKIIYIRDSVDEQILNSINHLTRDYVSWVKPIIEANGFRFETVTGNQKELCEQYGKEPDTIVFGPNLHYDLKIWEEHRGLNIGFRPSELLIDPTIPVEFMFTFNEELTAIRKNESDIVVAVQVRFGNEYPNKIPNASWNSPTELVQLIKKLKENERIKIILIGETEQKIEPLKKIVDGYLINRSTFDNYNALGFADYSIGFSGYFANLTLLQGKKMMRMLWDNAECRLQNNDQQLALMIHFDHSNIMHRLEHFTRMIQYEKDQVRQ